MRWRRSGAGSWTTGSCGVQWCYSPTNLRLTFMRAARSGGACRCPAGNLVDDFDREVWFCEPGAAQAGVEREPQRVDVDGFAAYGDVGAARRLPYLVFDDRGVRERCTEHVRAAQTAAPTPPPRLRSRKASASAASASSHLRPPETPVRRTNPGNCQTRQLRRATGFDRCTPSGPPPHVQAAPPLTGTHAADALAVGLRHPLPPPPLQLFY
jgi:hypothetical protein